MIASHAHEGRTAIAMPPRCAQLKIERAI